MLLAALALQTHAMPRKPRMSNNWRSDPPDVYGRLQHWACFHCRKTFKSSLSDERLCPQCHQPMTNMGTDFRAPRQDDQEQWQKVRALAEVGVRFFPFGRDELPGQRPATLAEVPAFLRRIYPPSEGQWLLEREGETRPRAHREGKVEVTGHPPRVTHTLLGRLLNQGDEVQVWYRGAWRKAVKFGGQGNLLRVDGKDVIPLNEHLRLRWPQT